MILYNLKCSNDHQFEAWFKDSKAYDKQAKRGDIECPTCSDKSIDKAIMAPRVSSLTRKKGLEYESSNSSSNFNKKNDVGIDRNKKSAINSQLIDVVEKIQKHVEENCENVGTKFADEARAIHYGEAKERGIYGEATQAEIKDLTDEDIPVSRIPWKKQKLS